MNVECTRILLVINNLRIKEIAHRRISLISWTIPRSHSSVRNLSNIRREFKDFPRLGSVVRHRDWSCFAHSRSVPASHSRRSLVISPWHSWCVYGDAGRPLDRRRRWSDLGVKQGPLLDPLYAISSCESLGVLQLPRKAWKIHFGFPRERKNGLQIVVFLRFRILSFDLRQLTLLSLLGGRQVGILSWNFLSKFFQNTR